MAQEVVKRDGSRQPFDAEKIYNAIRVAAKEAGMAEERIEEIVDQASAPVLEWAGEQGEVLSAEIRERVLEVLDKIAPEAAVAWRAHDEQKGM